MQAGRLRRAARFDVGNHNSRILAQIQSGGQRGRDRLHLHSNFAAMKVAGAAKLVVSNVHDGAGNREAQAFVSSGRGDDERVHSHHFAADVDQRTAGISRIDGSVSLNINHRRIRLGLARGGADHSHAYGIAKALRAAKCKNKFALAKVGKFCHGNRGQILCLDFEDGQVNVGCHANNSSGKDCAAIGQGVGGRHVSAGAGQNNLDSLRSLHHMRVGDDVSRRIDNEAGTDCPLAADHDTPAGIAVAIVIIQRSIAGHQNLDDTGGYLGDQRFNGGIYFAKRVGVVVCLRRGRRWNREQSDRDERENSSENTIPASAGNAPNSFQLRQRRSPQRIAGSRINSAERRLQAVRRRAALRPADLFTIGECRVPSVRNYQWRPKLGDLTLNY